MGIMGKDKKDMTSSSSSAIDPKSSKHMDESMGSSKKPVSKSSSSMEKGGSSFGSSGEGHPAGMLGLALLIAYFGLTIVLHLASLAIIALSITAAAKLGPDHPFLFFTFPMGSVLFLGTIMVLVSHFGLKKILSVVGVVLITAALALQIYLLVYATTISTDDLDTTCSNYWDDLSSDTQAKIQDTFNCCGFSSITDRPSNSTTCPVDATDGCSSHVKDGFDFYLDSNIPIFVPLVILEGIAIGVVIAKAFFF